MTAQLFTTYTRKSILLQGVEASTGVKGIAMVKFDIP
jgi:hypothetical protein